MATQHPPAPGQQLSPVQFSRLAHRGVLLGLSISQLIVLGIGIDPTRALVISQVVLAFGIPFALVPLLLLTRRRDVMGELVNEPRTTVVAALVAAVIITLNAVLLTLLL